ncbi:MAG: cellulase family glycosylhydrolase [Candidatus Eremiobacteraeota bacterium]|nr:cellulase family glycosylhydrolase [Candidatus Eremiobacteraeota bacterium]
MRASSLAHCAARGVAAVLLLGAVPTVHLRAQGTTPAAMRRPVPVYQPGVRQVQQRTGGGQWTAAHARAWYDSVGWVAGSNFLPSTASNELEMWQAATWDPATIDKELGYAQSLGMNTMRVYLHDLAYREDPQGFLSRVDQFLTIAEKHHIRPMLVLFDACWDPFPHTGPQREPYPFVHNSTWVQSPGRAILTDTAKQNSLRPYVTGVISRFGKDRRVLMWDVMNEPDNDNHPAYYIFEPRNKSAYSLVLLKKAFGWARATGASQPLTTGPWKGDYVDTATMLPITKWQLEHSDVITFHSYDPLPRTEQLVDALKRYDRPIILSEYMARPIGSTFQTHLPWLASAHVGAINWGFVQGRSQTFMPWDSWYRVYTAEPAVWFHDIFRTNGTPYRPEEVAVIRQVTSENVKGAPKRAAATGGE